MSSDPTDPGLPQSHILRVDHPVFMSLRQLDRQLEVIAGRPVKRTDVLRVALICAENTPDDVLRDYLEGSETDAT
jgi:hypothetical protein